MRSLNNSPTYLGSGSSPWERWSSAHPSKVLITSSRKLQKALSEPHDYFTSDSIFVLLCPSDKLWFSLLSKSPESWELISRNVRLIPKVLKKKILLVSWFKPQPIPISKEKWRFFLWLVVSFIITFEITVELAKYASFYKQGQDFGSPSIYTK